MRASSFYFIREVKEMYDYSNAPITSLRMLFDHIYREGELTLVSTYREGELTLVSLDSPQDPLLVNAAAEVIDWLELQEASRQARKKAVLKKSYGGI
jgi:hypothetical protein